MVQMPPINYTKSMFASIIEHELSEDVRPEDIKLEGKKLSYTTPLKKITKKLHDIESDYNKKRDYELDSLKNILNQKLITPVSGVIKYGKNRLSTHKFDDFVEAFGPNYLKKINSRMKEIPYNNIKVGIVAELDENHRYKDVTIVPFIKNESLQNNAFDSSILGHDVGDSYMRSYVTEGTVFEKGF